MVNKLVIAIVIVSSFIILYIYFKRLSSSLSRKRKYREVEERIKERIKPLSRKKGTEKRYLVSEYEECIRMTKDKDVKAWGWWLLAQFCHNNLHRGKDYLEKTIACYTEIEKEFSDYPFHEESLFLLANLLFFEKSDYKKMCEVYRNLLRNYPQSKWASIAKERIELVRNNLTHPQALNSYVLAEKYFEQGKYERSIQNLLNIIEEYPKASLAGKALYFLGDIYHFKIKDYRKAIAEYQNLIQKFPQNRFVANAQFKIGECCRKLEKWRDAIKAYGKFIEDYSQYGYSDYAQFYVGQCYEKLGEWREANDAYSSISMNYPESIWADVARNRIKYLNKQMGG